MKNIDYSNCSIKTPLRHQGENADNQGFLRAGGLPPAPTLQICSLPILEEPRTRGSEPLVRLQDTKTGRFLDKRYTLSEAALLVENSKEVFK